MASGFGFGGGRSRCFTFWQEFQKCYANADAAIDCIAQKEDYMECLHHAKEIDRVKTIRDHFLARQAHEAKVAREKGELRATSSIMRLGIIGKDSGNSDSESSASSSSSSSSSPPPKEAEREPKKEKSEDVSKNEGKSEKASKKDK